MTASKIRHLLIAAAAGAASPAVAQPFQDVAAIDRQVARTLGAGIGQPGGPAHPVDQRLRLTACPAALIVEPPVLGAVTVRCQPIGWRIRVPLQPAAAAPAQNFVDVSQPEQASAPAPAPRPVRTARAEAIVHRGDPVDLVVITGGFTVSHQAVADQDGAAGDRIRVRTDPRAAPIIGQVMPDGRVAMGGFN